MLLDHSRRCVPLAKTLRARLAGWARSAVLRDFARKPGPPARICVSFMASSPVGVTWRASLWLGADMREFDLTHVGGATLPVSSELALPVRGGNYLCDPAKLWELACREFDDWLRGTWDWGTLSASTVLTPSAPLALPCSLVDGPVQTRVRCRCFVFRRTCSRVLQEALCRSL